MRFKIVCALAVLSILFAGCGNDSKKTAVQPNVENGKEALSLGSAKQKKAAADESVFSVVSFNPSNEIPSAVKYPSVYVQFSQPVVPLEALGKQSSESSVMTIEPPLKGVYRWYGTSVLSFDSEDSVILHKSYKVTVNSELTSVSGQKITGKNVFTFTTEELKLLSIIPGYTSRRNGAYFDDNDVPVKNGLDIALIFSTPVELNLVEKHITLSSGDVSFPFTVSRPQTFGDREYEGKESEGQEGAIAVITPVQQLPENSEIVVTLKAGARNDESESGTSADQAKKFRTIQPFGPSWTETEGESTSMMSNPVYIQFTHQLKEAETDKDKTRIASLIKTKPEMNVGPENILVQGGRLTIHSLPVTFGQSYTLTVQKGIEDMYGRLSKNPIELEVKVPNARSYADFKDWGMCMLEAQFHPKLIFEMQNITKKSSYFIQSLRDPSKIVQKSYENQAMKENVRYAEVVELQPVLNETQDGYRGSVHFHADIEVKNKDRVRNIKNDQYVQVTDLGVTVRYAYNKAAVLVTKISTGEPVPDADVALYCTSYRTKASQIAAEKDIKLLKCGKTNSDGFAVIHFAPGELLSSCGEDRDILVKASSKGDSALFKPQSHELYRFDINYISSVFTAEDEVSKVFIFTDRFIYKPGETMTFRGIDRTLKNGEYTNYTGEYTVEIRPDAWRAEKIVSFTGKASEAGGFYHSWKIPEDAKPTDYLISYKRAVKNGKKQREHTEPFTVQFFEKRRFQSSASIADMVYVRGNSVESSFSASYLGGGSLGGVKYEVDWYMEPVGFTLPSGKYEGWKFGPAAGYEGRTSIKTDRGALSDDGTARSSCVSGSEKIKGLAYNYRAEVRITDAGNQMISTSVSETVHPGLYYIGISPYEGTGFPGAKKEISFKYSLTDPKGETPNESLFTIKGKKQQITAELLREEWKVVRQMSVSGYLNSRYVREFIPEMKTIIPIQKDGAISVTPEQGGSYILRLTSADSRGNDIITEKRFYVSGSGRWYNPQSDGTQISLTPDKDVYSPGTSAKLLMQSELPSGTYMITVEREGIIEEFIKKLDTPSTVIEIPIKESYVPIVYVCVSSFSVRTKEPSHTFATEDLDKPKGYFGVTALKIDTSSVRFDIDIKTDKQTYKPGEKAVFTLTAIKDGNPVKNAEIVLLAVDRGVIDIVDYHIPDPALYFYSEEHFPIRVKGGDSRAYLIDPVTYEVKNLVGGDSSDTKMKERKNFNPTAFFVPSITTDENGRAVYESVMPDSLTEYRVTAVGIKDNSFAKTEVPLVVNNPLSVRHVLPRRLRKGDDSQAGVVVSNIGSSAQQVTISIKSDLASGALSKTADVMANKTVSVMFDIHANENGTIPIEFIVSGAELSEKIIDAVIVERPIITETVAAVGRVDEESGMEMIVFPDNQPKSDGSLSISAGPSMLSSLSDAIDYVFKYPYGCLEQRSAAILPLVYFGEYINTFDLDSSVKNYKKTIYDEVSSWAPSQLSNGGFPYWKNGRNQSLEATLRIAEILAAAQKAVIPLPDKPDTIKLTNAVDFGADEYVTKYSKSYPAQSLYIRAYADYVMALLGRYVPEENLQKTVNSEYADIEETAFAALSYYERGNKDKAAEIAEKLKAYTRPTVRGVELTSRRQDRAWSFFGGKTEQYSLMLKLFSLVSDNKDFTDRIVYELQEIKKSGQGRWRSTADTSRALDAFSTYIRAGNDTAKFTASVLLGQTEILSKKFTSIAAQNAAKTLSFSTEPIASFERGKSIPLTFTKKGKGTLFYNTVMTYEIPVEKQTMRDEGIGVFIEVCEEPSGKKVTDGVLQQNITYRAYLTVMTNRDRTFTALRSPIPSCCEILSAPVEQNWYDECPVTNRYIYDNEIQYFWNEMNKGVYRLEFTFRAVRAGRYPTPAATAECMYEPEIFGRSNGTVYTIK